MSEKDIKQEIDAIAQKFNEQIEIYAAAFVKHMGTDKASEYVLIQQVFPAENKVIYRYEHRDTIAPIKAAKNDLAQNQSLLDQVEQAVMEQGLKDALVSYFKQRIADAG